MVLSASSECLDNSERKFHVGQVQYIDYETERLTTGLPAAYCKRKSFEFERELRVIFQTDQYLSIDMDQIDIGAMEYGYYVPVNLERLINMVFVAPTSSSFYVKAVKGIMTAFAPGMKVTKLSLLDPSLY